MSDDLTWRKSSYSNGESACLEMAADPDHTRVHIRDSKQQPAGSGTSITFPAPAWSLFLAATTAD